MNFNWDGICFDSRAARHGHGLNGKLARIARQELDLLASAAKCRPHEELSAEVLTLENESVYDCSTAKRKKSKKSRKRDKTVAAEEVSEIKLENIEPSGTEEKRKKKRQKNETVEAPEKEFVADSENIAESLEHLSSKKKKKSKKRSHD